MELPWLLRIWRTDVVGVQQSVVVDRLGVSKSALSMWENGDRRPSLQQLEGLDACFAAAGALVDLAQALGTPNGLPARHMWAHNPQGPSRPHWAWLRPRPGAGRVRARLRWGAFRLDCSEPCDDRGIFVTSPASMPNPAAWVLLAQPGWVDFGRGEIPGQLGIPTVDSLSAAEISGGGHTPAGLVAPRLVERFLTDSAFAAKVLDFFGDRPDLVRQVFSTRDGWHGIARIGEREGPLIDAHPPFTARQYRALREARGLSQAEVAELVTRLLPEHPVGDDQIRGLELGRNPRPRHLRSRLDTVYRADGWTCVEPVAATDRRGSGAETRWRFDFPEFWIGPVWIDVEPVGRQAEGGVRLEWGVNIKPMVVSRAAAVTCRKPFLDAGPLFVFAPAAWRVRAGMGSRPEARDVNFGWSHDSDDDAAVADQKAGLVNETFLEWFGRTPAELIEFVRREAGDLL